MAKLLNRAFVHASGALNSKTQSSYNKIFLKYCHFAHRHHLPLSQPSPQSLVAFIEQLVAQGITYPTIANHISALKSQFTRFNLPSQALDSPIVLRLLRSIDKNVPRPLAPKSVFTISQLVSLVQLAHKHPLAVLLVPLFLLAFFAFLRISNLLPKSKYHWDNHHTLLRKDISFTPSGLTIVLRWTKSRQSRSQISKLQVPALPSHPLCPVAAVSRLFGHHPLPQDAPCFAYRAQGRIFCLTQMQARLALKWLCLQLNLPYNQLGFHAFRRSGVAFLFANGVPLPI